MDINLITESMLGHACSSSGIWHCEFQFGSRLIYVAHHHGEPPYLRLAAAQRVVKAVWDDIPLAVKFAEKHYEAQMPELMRMCTTHMPLVSPLSVYSIHFELDKPYPSCTIAQNHDFDWSRISMNKDELCLDHGGCTKQDSLEDDLWVCVRRLGFQRFELDD